MGDSTLLLGMWIVRFHQHRYFKRRDFSLPSTHNNSILFRILLHKRYLQGRYDSNLLVCVLRCATVSFHLVLFFISSVGHECKLTSTCNLFSFRIILN